MGFCYEKILRFQSRTDLNDGNKLARRTPRLIRICLIYREIITRDFVYLNEEKPRISLYIVTLIIVFHFF